jgi:hypothetical protein
MAYSAKVIGLLQIRIMTPGKAVVMTLLPDDFLSSKGGLSFANSGEPCRGIGCGKDLILAVMSSSFRWVGL